MQKSKHILTVIHRNRFKMRLAILTIFEIISLTTIVDNEAKTYTMIKGFRWVKHCRDEYGHMLICPEGAVTCFVNTIVHKTKHENNITSAIQCLNKDDVLKSDTFTSFYPCNCDQIFSIKSYNESTNVTLTQVLTVTLDEI